MAIICLLLTACDKDEVSPANSMKWSYEILTPANVKFLKSTAEVSPAYFFETNGKGGDMVMTCENFDVLNPISADMGLSTSKFSQVITISPPLPFVSKK